MEPKKVRRRLRRRLLFYGSFFAALWGFYVWQPWEFDFIPRELPKSNPPVLPEPERLFAKGTRVALITAHPDDSEFYIAGTLLQLGRSGALVSQIVVTDGDKGYYPFEDWRKNARVRQQEQWAASGRWGVKEIAFLGFPDGRLRADVPVERAIRLQLERIQPDYILLFDSEYPPRFSHGDHRQAGVATERAARSLGKPVWLMRFSTMAPNFVRDITAEWDTKSELLGVHKSQFFGERLERVRNMVASRAEDDGERIGVALGEGFRCEKLTGSTP